MVRGLTVVDRASALRKKRLAAWASRLALSRTNLATEPYPPPTGSSRWPSISIRRLPTRPSPDAGCAGRSPQGFPPALNPDAGNAGAFVNIQLRDRHAHAQHL